MPKPREFRSRRLTRPADIAPRDIHVGTWQFNKAACLTSRHPRTRPKASDPKKIWLMPHVFREDIRVKLEEVAEHWNRVEIRAKRAEKICSYPIIPAINELRYAGRQLADALEFLVRGQDWDRSIYDRITIARQYLYNADHDVTDALIDFIKLELDGATAKYGDEYVRKHYPYLDELQTDIERANDLASDSRGDRRNRAVAYVKIQQILEKPGGLVDKYRKYKKFEPRIIYEALLVQRRAKLMARLAICGAIASIVSLAVTVATLVLS